MFTGIITHLGTIVAIRDVANLEKEVDISLPIGLDLLEIGQSIACDGICLTITKLVPSEYSTIATFFVSHETLHKTIACFWQVQQQINIEFAMQMTALFNGHMVSGHVDGVATVKGIKKISDSHIVEIYVEEFYKDQIITKGSIAINGVSLTINEILDNYFTVNIIPHSWDNTNIHLLKRDDIVNIETDMMAKYIKKYFDNYAQKKQ